MAVEMLLGGERLLTALASTLELSVRTVRLLVTFEMGFTNVRFITALVRAAVPPLQGEPGTKWGDKYTAHDKTRRLIIHFSRAKDNEQIFQHYIMSRIQCHDSLKLIPSTGYKRRHLLRSLCIGRRPHMIILWPWSESYMYKSCCNGINSQCV